MNNFWKPISVDTSNYCLPDKWQEAERLEYRRLGKTELKVSVVSYGAAPLGNEYRQIDISEGIRSLHLALDLGVNFIDTSPYYGRTKSESVLGQGLAQIDRNRYYLATKVGRYDLDEFDFSADRVAQSIDKSLQRLGVDYLDLIQCHDIEFGNLDQVVNETIPALQKAKQQGKVRFIGITGLPLKIFCYILDRIEVDTILSYCHYSLNDTALEDLIPYLETKDVGIISASPLSMRLLTNLGPPDWHPSDDETKQVCAQVAAHCRCQGGDLAELGMQFSLANPKIHSTLMGTANPDNVRKNIDCLTSTYNANLLAEVQEMLKPIHNRTWISGYPENN